MPTPPTSPATIQRIQELYRDGTPIEEIERALKISRPTLYKYLKAAGGNDRYSARPDHSVWHEAFDDLTDDAAYWVGLLLTDGSIVGNGRRVKLSLQERDAPTLERFRSFVRTSAQLSKVESGSRGLRFSSPKMCARLAQLGVIPRKTYIATAPDCLLSNRHFWRGVIDGDACLIVGADGSPGVRLTGSSFAPLLGQWVSACASQLSISTYVQPRPQNPRVSDVIVNGAPSVQLMHWLYAGCTTASPVIDRKLKTYHDVCSIHGHRRVGADGRYAWGSRKK